MLCTIYFCNTFFCNVLVHYKKKCNTLLCITPESIDIFCNVLAHYEKLMHYEKMGALEKYMMYYKKTGSQNLQTGPRNHKQEPQLFPSSKHTVVACWAIDNGLHDRKIKTKPQNTGSGKAGCSTNGLIFWPCCSEETSHKHSSF